MPSFIQYLKSERSFKFGVKWQKIHDLTLLVLRKNKQFKHSVFTVYSSWLIHRKVDDVLLYITELNDTVCIKKTRCRQ